MSTTRHKLPGQGGFAVIAALFILVVLAALGGYLALTSSTQGLTQAQDALASRAMQASRAGLEWAMYQVTRTTAPAFKTSCEAAGATYAGATPATQVFAAGSFAGLDEFRVEVECRSQSYSEAAATYRVYELTSTACSGGVAACPAASPPGVAYSEHRQRVRVRL